jgi:hypothetical protein
VIPSGLSTKKAFLLFSTVGQKGFQSACTNHNTLPLGNRVKGDRRETGAKQKRHRNRSRLQQVAKETVTLIEMTSISAVSELWIAD